MILRESGEKPPYYPREGQLANHCAFRRFLGFLPGGPKAEALLPAAHTGEAGLSDVCTCWE